jgi:hypothetical protein
MELSSLLSRPPVPNYIDFTRRQKGERVEKLGTEPYCNSFWLKAKVLADSGDAASTADDVASRISDRLPVGLIEVAAIEQPPAAWRPCDVSFPQLSALWSETSLTRFRLLVGLLVTVAPIGTKRTCHSR